MSRVVSMLLVAGALVLGTTACGTHAPGTSGAPAQEPSVQGNQRDYENSMIIAGCLEEKGWEVEVTPTGGWGVEAHVPTEQFDSYQADYDACASEAGLDDIEMTPELASEVYDNNLRVIDCLKGEGYSVEDPPARDSFVAKIVENPDGDFWNPYSLVPENAMPAAVLACPQ